MKFRIPPLLARAARGLAIALAVAAGGAGASERSLLDFALHPATTIPCADTPFGRSVTIGGEFEGIQFIQTTNSSVADEYQPLAGTAPAPPLQRSIRSSLAGNAQLAGTTLQKAIAVDLNGDGRDEVVAALRVSSSVVRLAVFNRNGNVFNFIDYWDVTQSSNAVDLVAGDFDGSADGKEEIALLLRVLGVGTYVYVLSGDGDGRIAQDIGSWLGRWLGASNSVGQISITAGDVLLDGRDQIIVVAETGTGQSRGLTYSLLEYLPTTSALPIAAGNTAIGSLQFNHAFAGQFMGDEGSGPALDSVNKVEADAGDLVDSAAAELVVHVQFASSSFNYIGRRLHHFNTTRDANNAITAISIAERVQGQQPWDTSQIVQQQNEDGLKSFEAVIANIDRVSPAELVYARADVNPRLLVSAWKARVNSTASYTYVANGLVVQFTDTSTGAIVSREWTFGDNSGSFPDINPTHTYAAAGTYTARLRVTYAGGEVRDYTRSIAVTTGGNSSGGIGSTWLYNFPSAPAYEAFYTVDGTSSLQNVQLAVADLDKDGIFEVLTAARNNSTNMLRSVWRLTNTANPLTFSGRHQSEADNSLGSLVATDLVAADFDGNSAQATLGADCRKVIEPQLRQVVWMPPYFSRLQDGADKEATFGESTSGGTGFERRAGTFTSHDVSAYVGVSVGSDLLGVDVSVKATAGYNYQASYGALHGTENSLTVGESYSQSGGDGLVVVEQNSFNCFSYDISSQAGGLDGNSRMRMCEVLPEERFISGSDAYRWDTEVPAATPAHPPAQWAPLHRDWASLSLFKPVATTTASLVSASAATDGLFGTATSMAGNAGTPYLDIDLGTAQRISNIRVFPAANQAASLKGFRIYASTTPFAGSGVPSGADVTSFAPETEDDVGLDRWNVWTRDRDDPEQMLLARYVRLQHPAAAALRVAEIQVFGDVHVEPQSYPEAVCDPDKNDGLFKALVWNPASGSNGAFQAIDVRGTLLWNGSGTATWPSPGCTNYSGLLARDIWNNVNLGDSATASWNLSDSTSSIIGSNTSFESSVRVGAEFDLEAGFIATVQAGGAYEYSSGITEETQSSSFWGTGLDIGGAMGGFQVPGTFTPCRYNARPYAYQFVDRSNTGYEHTAYMVDYVVRQGSGGWTRANVPSACRTITDRLFADGFE